jgi:hypothetical protein
MMADLRAKNPAGPVKELLSPVLRSPPNLEEFLRASGVNLKMWEVERHVLNLFEQGSKHPETGDVTIVPLYQLKVWLKKIAGAEEAQVVKDTLEWIGKHSPVAKKVVVAARSGVGVDDPVLLELAVPDLHLGKLTWAPETGEDYDAEIAQALHQQAVEALWNRASVFPIRKVLMVCGNDFFNVNSAANTTYAGTPQSEDSRWPRTFRRGIATLHRAIEFIRTRCPDVEVRFIRGNHDSERLFMAGEVIAAMYESAENVTIVNQIHKRQYARWGDVLLGWTHGDGVKSDKLALIMAGEAEALWGGARHREIHLGHFHHKQETQYHVGSEHNAVRVRVLPSLTTADEWHSTMGFVGQQRAAECYLWGQKACYLGHFSWSPTTSGNQHLG